MLAWPAMPDAFFEAMDLAQSRFAQSLASLDLRTPSLHFDQRAIEHNLDAMIARVGDPARWQPHVKTHKCAEIVKLCMHRGITQFKCTTLSELTYIAKFAATQSTSIKVCCTYPFYGKQWSDAWSMAQQFPNTTVTWLLDSPAHYHSIGHVALPLLLALDIDTGMGRSGSSFVAWTDFLQEQSTQLQARGHTVAVLHGYEGHLAWDQKDKAFVGYEQLLKLREHCASLGMAPAIITSGSHSYAHALEHPDLERLGSQARVSPGTIVLSDLHSKPAHVDLGLQFGALVASRVISVNEQRITLDAGSKALSPDVQDNIARIVGHPGWVSSFQHEEHLVMQAEDLAKPCFQPGEIVWLVPAHVCTTVNLHDRATLHHTQDKASPVQIASGHPWAQARLSYQEDQ